MSALTRTVITCDGPKVGASITCTADASTADMGITAIRRYLRRHGWTRRHHGDQQVDLCPHCTPRARLAPHRAGRPRKEPRTP